MGLAVGLDIEALLKVPEGLQLYASAPKPPLPVAFRFAFDVLQII